MAALPGTPSPGRCPPERGNLTKHKGEEAPRRHGHHPDAAACRLLPSQEQLIDEVLEGYRNHSLPLNHLVMDMDWHIEPSDKTCNRWGGTTWNTKLFPDPGLFISQLHSANNTVGRPLKLLLNVHPGNGVDHCQLHYADVARANGVSD